MDATAKVSSKGQITLPKEIREALGLHRGDEVLFRVHDGRAVLAKVPDLLELAGSVPVPPEWKGASWQAIKKEAWRQRGPVRR
jgi:AbrB family looped-hinge helix DNA binding protein